MSQGLLACPIGPGSLAYTYGINWSITTPQIGTGDVKGSLVNILFLDSTSGTSLSATQTIENFVSTCQVVPTLLLVGANTVTNFSNSATCVPSLLATSSSTVDPILNSANCVPSLIAIVSQLVEGPINLVSVVVSLIASVASNVGAFINNVVVITTVHTVAQVSRLFRVMAESRQNLIQSRIKTSIISPESRDLSSSDTRLLNISEEDRNSNIN